MSNNFLLEAEHCIKATFSECLDFTVILLGELKFDLEDILGAWRIVLSFQILFSRLFC